MYAGASTSLSRQGGWSNHWRCRIDGGTADDLQSASPAEFDGPGDRWSPERCLSAPWPMLHPDVSCLANASRLSWISLDCDVTGTLDRVDRVTQFTRFDMTAHLVVPAGVDADGHDMRSRKRNGTA